MKVKLKTDGFKVTQVLIDDKDVSYGVIEATVNVKGGCIPTVVLKLRPEDIEVDGNFECLKEKTKDDYTLEELVEKVSEKLVSKMKYKKG